VEFNSKGFRRSKAQQLLSEERSVDPGCQTFCGDCSNSRMWLFCNDQANWRAGSRSKRESERANTNCQLNGSENRSDSSWSGAANASGIGIQAQMEVAVVMQTWPGAGQTGLRRLT